MRKMNILWVLLLAGCSAYNAQYQVPVPADHLKEHQTKLQAARHWEIIAEDIATESVRALKKHHIETLPLTVNQADNENEFSDALNQFVLSELVDQNVKIKVKNESSVVMTHDIQVVEFQANRSNRRDSNYYPGKNTAISAGLILLSDAVYKWSRDSVRLGSLAVAAGSDVFEMSKHEDDSQISIPNVEVIVNTSIVKDDVFVMRKSDIYYIHDKDISLYEDKRLFKSKTLKVVR